MNTRLHVLNSIVNVFWTGLCCAPVVLFWIDNYEPISFFLLLSFSCVFLFFPVSLFNAPQISKSKSFYEKLGVRHALLFTQDGKIINNLVKRTNPNYKAVSSKTDLLRLHKKMMAYEKYHLMCCVFFFCTFIWAILHSEYTAAALMFLANVAYNIYPLLIQQYNRLRMGKSAAGSS